MTNYEKIKAMSIDEMAEFLHLEGYYCNVCQFYHAICPQDRTDCKKVVKQWLEQESED